MRRQDLCRNSRIQGAILVLATIAEARAATRCPTQKRLSSHPYFLLTPHHVLHVTARLSSHLLPTLHHELHIIHRCTSRTMLFPDYAHLTSSIGCAVHHINTDNQIHRRRSKRTQPRVDYGESMENEEMES